MRASAPPPERVEAVHRRLLERWRRAVNLVGPGPLEPHFADARAVARLLEPRGTWADLGSGAGFPGIALAAWHPACTVLLVESRSRRAAFLRVVLREAGLANARVFHQRAEELPPGSLDGVVARAFAPPGRYLALAAPLLRPGGLAAVLAGPVEPGDFPGYQRLWCRAYASAPPRRLALYRRLPA